MSNVTPADVFDFLCAVQRAIPVFSDYPPWPYAEPSLKLLSQWRHQDDTTERLDLNGEQWGWRDNGIDEKWWICTGRKTFEHFATREEADARLMELGWILVEAAPVADHRHLIDDDGGVL